MKPKTEKPELTKGVARWLIRESLGVATVGVLLLVSAGRWHWPAAWILVGIYALWVTANAVLLIPRSPELLIERAARRKSDKTWDTLLLSILGVFTIAKYVVAGLHLRHGWPGAISERLGIPAAVIAAFGYGLITWSMAANAYFSQVVRIQEDRGHAVATKGPYASIRHPGYTGTILFELASPVLLGSLWVLALGALNAALRIIRTALEDRTLKKELDGYEAYARHVRYRLIPGIW